MRKVMETLRELQTLTLTPDRPTEEQQAEVNQLRAQVPARILSHFDRLIARGKKGVALARQGACGACHLRISSGTIQRLAHAGEVHLCDHCGCYLYLAECESLNLSASSLTPGVLTQTVARRSLRNAVSHVA